MNYKYLIGIAVVIVALLAMQFSNCGCSSTRVSTETNLRTAKMAWPAVRIDLEVGLDAALESGGLTIESRDSLQGEVALISGALNAGHNDKVAFAFWPTLRPYALMGIDAQLNNEPPEISEGVAESLREQVKQFTAVMLKLQEAPE